MEFEPLPIDPTPEWVEHAECRGLDPELFHPLRGQSTTAAKAVCAVCVVRSECLDHALANHETRGVWGGTTGRERRRMRVVR